MSFLAGSRRRAIPLAPMLEDLNLVALSSLAATFDLGLVVHFGSRARGEARPDSDFDLGLLHREGRRLRHAELRDLHVALSSWLGAEADVTDLSSSDAILRYEVAAAGRPLFEVQPDAWTDFAARALIDHDDIAPFIKACVAAVGAAARSTRP